MCVTDKPKNRHNCSDTPYRNEDYRRCDDLPRYDDRLRYDDQFRRDPRYDNYYSDRPFSDRPFSDTPWRNSEWPMSPYQDQMQRRQPPFMSGLRDFLSQMLRSAGSGGGYFQRAAQQILARLTARFN